MAIKKLEIFDGEKIIELKRDNCVIVTKEKYAMVTTRKRSYFVDAEAQKKNDVLELNMLIKCRGFKEIGPDIYTLNMSNGKEILYDAKNNYVITGSHDSIGPYGLPNVFTIYDYVRKGDKKELLVSHINSDGQFLGSIYNETTNKKYDTSSVNFDYQKLLRAERR